MTTADDDHDRPAPSNRMRLLGPRPATGDRAGSPPARRLRRTRAVIAWVLVVLAVVLVPISVVTVWAVNTVTDTDHYVATLAPLARERVVTDYVAMDATDQPVREAERAAEARRAPCRRRPTSWPPR